MGYLDAMGIQVWVRRSEAQSIVIPAPEALIVAPEITTAMPPEDVPTTAVETDIFSETTWDWDSLRAQVQNCTRCALAQNRTQTVFGSGNLNAQIMLVGEAPGAQEDAQGEVFVGAAGQLLDAMLAAIGLTRAEVFIGNVLKCRPPQNRSPHAGEIEACAAYLHAQIELVRPRLLVALGAIAAHHLLGSKENVSALRGSLHDYRGIPVLVSFHPAYLLRAPTHKREAWEDLKQVWRYRQRLPDALKTEQTTS
jgi:uracil-DNA glycosylase